MKTNLISFVASIFLVLGMAFSVHADGAGRKIDGSHITKPEVVILNPPITVTTKMALDDINIADRFSFVQTRIKRYECNTWDEVLALHAPSSIKQLNKPESKKHFEEYKKNKNPRECGFSFVSYISYEQNGDAIIITQSVPFELKNDNYNSYSFFRIDGCRKVGNQWKIDGTLLSTELATIIISTPPIKLQEKIDEWWKSSENEAQR